MTMAAWFGAVISGGGCPARAIVMVSYGGVADGAGDGGDGADLEVLHLAIDESQDLFDRKIEQRVARVSALRIRPITIDASMPCPATSPTTIHTSPDGSVNTSYQSPPMASPSAGT